MRSAAAAALTALAFFVAAVVVGCGTKTRVEVRTDRVEPCATAKQMTECIRDLVNAALHASGDVGTVRVSCEKPGAYFSCLSFVDLGSGQQTCVRYTIKRVGPGIPFLAKSENSYDCPWTS